MAIDVKSQYDLTKCNTFKLSAKAKELIEITSTDVLREAADYLASRPDERFMILGAGADVLFVNDFNGIILLNQLSGIKLVDEDGEDFYVEIASGEIWHSFVRRTLDANKPGLENLALIPGTVGGAVVQNIGAYGKEIAEHIVEVEVFDLKTREFRTLEVHDCDFAYRSSIFKNPENSNLFITKAKIRIPKTWTPEIQYKDLFDELERNNIQNLFPEDVYSAVVALRQRKLPHPKKLGNAGSFFKNPIVTREQFNAIQERYPSVVFHPLAGGRYKLSAAWLIDQAGMKGIRMGDCGTYEKQPLVIINYGYAKGEDIYAMAQEVKMRVKNQFGIRLVAEVIVVHG